MIPTLSAIQQWKPDDMDNAASHFNDLANNREDTMAAIHNVNTGVWTGEGGEGKDAAMAHHAIVANMHAQTLRATASVAKAGGKDLYGLQQAILKTVDTAQSSSFQVGEDWSLTDTMTDPYARLARQGIAKSIQGTLAGQVGAFTSQQATTAAGIMSASAGLAPGGKVECYGPDENHTYCVEMWPDGSLHTISPGIPAMAGSWPDAAKVGEGHVSAMGHGHIDSNGQCDDPEWQDHMNRSLLSQVVGGAAMGGVASIPLAGVPALPLMAGGAALAGIRWFLSEVESDGPACQ